MSDHNQYCNMDDNFEDEKLENKDVKESDELLIDAVRAYPHLYNHKDLNFKNNLMKENSWKEIALAVNIPASDCQIRWVRLRERFGKEKRQRELDSRSGSGISKRSVFTYYENMSFLNDHIKRRKSYTNISNLKRPKMMEVTANKPHTYISSTILSAKKDKQEINLSTNSAIIENTELPASQLSNVADVADQVPIQPCANFLTLRKNFLPDTDPASSSITSFNNGDSSLTSSSRHFPNALHSPDEYNESTRSSIFSMQESTSSSAPTTCQATPQRSSFKKKSNLVELESSLMLLCQSMHQSFQNNCNSEVTDSLDETFAKLIVHQLDKLPLHEKQKRQQAMMQILYEPYA